MDQQTVPTENREPTPETQSTETNRPHRSRLWLWLALLALVVVGLWIGLGRRGTATAATNRRGPAITPVVAAKVTKGDIGVYYTGLGAVTPLNTVTVHTRVDGQLMRVLYREGESVRKGDLLVEIDPRPFEVQLTQAEGALLRDQANLANARTDLARYQTLIQRNAVAQQVLATQQSTVAQLEGAVKTDQGLIDASKLNLIYCRVTAPVSGRVGLRLVDPGNIVHAADTNGLMVITQVQPISVIFSLPEDQLGPVLRRFRAGQQLEVDAFDRDMKNELARGRLATADNQIDPTTGTLKLRALFSNRDDSLFPNQFVNARLLVEEKRGVTLAPTAAIQRNAQNTYVYLVKPDKTVTVHPVTVGTTEGELTEVASGLSPGDVVVTTGVDKLQEGTKVNAQLGPPRNNTAREGSAGAPSGNPAAGDPASGQSPQTVQNAPALKPTDTTQPTGGQPRENGTPGPRGPRQ